MLSEDELASGLKRQRSWALPTPKRLTQLGEGHTLLFYEPEEVDLFLRQTADKLEAAIKNCGGGKCYSVEPVLKEVARVLKGERKQNEGGK